MGISEADLTFIAALGKLPRRVCDLGDQDLLCNNELVFDSLGLDAPRRGKSRDFWKALGSDYLALDVVGDAVRFDLNIDSAKPEWGQFDLVTNCGDTEHIINQVNCFTVMHDLTKTGGVMYHALPIAGYADHGFFNYNVKFFDALAFSNRYEIIRKETESIESGNAGIRIAMRKTSGKLFALPLDLPYAPPTFHEKVMFKLGRMIRR